jgi:hypothetical protein
MIAASDVTSLVGVRWSDMRQILVLAVVSAAAVLGSPGLAGAELVAPPSRLPVEMAWPVATGPGGAALAIVPTLCAGCNDGRLAERDPSGHWTPPTIVAPGMFPELVAWGPGAAAMLLTEANIPGGGAAAYVLRRPPGADRFGAPVAVALGGPIYSKLHTATDRNGDLAFVTDVKGPDSVIRTFLIAVTGHGAFGAPQELAASTETTAVAIGDGRVVVAYTSRRGVYARTGTIGSPLGAPQLLATRSVGEPGVAIDDAGDATVAFDRRGKTNFDHALMAARARPGERFGAPIVLGEIKAEFGFTAHGAAAATTTALIWQRPYSDDSRVHVAVARGAGRFGRSETMPGAGPAGSHGEPYQPVAAVGPTGDVLLAYAYNFDGAVHATVRRAGSPRFGPLHVISKLGEGGAPSVAWLSERRPLVVYHSRAGGLLATTHLTGPSPDLTPPRVDVRLSSDARDELRASNAVTVTVRCSEPCMLQTRASLRTHDGRAVADGVSRRLLRRDATFTERFAFDPDRRAGRAGDGSRVRVTVDAQNASGASREAVEQIEL